MDEALLNRRAEFLEEKKLQWELFGVDGQATTIEVRDGEVDTFKSSRNSGISLRVLREGRMGFSFSSDLSDAAFSRMVEQALASADAVEPNEHAKFTDDARAIADMPLVDPAPRKPTEEKVEAARSIERAARESDSRVKRVRKASLSESEGREWLLNHHGVRRTGAATFYSASVLAIAEDGADSQTGGEFGFGRSWEALDLTGIGRTAARRALARLGAGPMATGSRPVVFENEVVVDLLGVLAGSFIAESVQKNRSILAGKLGEAVMAPMITIVDDGLDIRGAAAFPFDGEGVKRQTTPIIAAGVLQTYLYDLETGSKDHKPSTGNAGRGGFRSPPHPGTTNLRLEPGEGSLESLCAEAGEGFLVTDLLGIHTANPVSGDFSVGAAGFEIRNGVIGRPVRGVAVADNVLGLFKRASRVAGDFRYFGSLGASSLLVPGVSVSGG